MNLTILTETEALNQGLIEHLEFTLPNERFDTQYGTITARQWMVFEAQRIAAAPGRVARLVERDSHVALFVNDIGSKN